MLAVIIHVVDDNIICLLATHQCMVRATQFNSCCTKLYFSLSYVPNRRLQARAELNRLQDLGSLYLREYELQFNKIEENKQRLDELWKSSNTTFE